MNYSVRSDTRQIVLTGAQPADGGRCTWTGPKVTQNIGEQVRGYTGTTTLFLTYPEHQWTDIGHQRQFWRRVNTEYKRMHARTTPLMQNPHFRGARAAQHLEPDESEFPGTSGPFRAADLAFGPRWEPEHTATGSKEMAAHEEGAPGTGSKCSRN